MDTATIAKQAQELAAGAAQLLEQTQKLAANAATVKCYSVSGAACHLPLFHACTLCSAAMHAPP